MQRAAVRRISFALIATAACATLAVHPSARSRSGQTDRASIRGQVVDAQTGARVSEAQVTVSRSGQTTWVGRTSTDGVFVATDLAPDFYQVRVTKVGYADAGPHQREPAGPMAPVVVGLGQRLQLDIRIWKLGSLAGIVVDEAGQPAVKVEVHALRASDAGTGALADAGSDTTDDRGEYRITSLLPGAYVVAVRSTRITYSASLRLSNLQRTPTFSNVELDGAVVEQSNALPIRRESGGLEIYPTTYYPQARDLRDAQSIALGPGEATGGLRIGIEPANAVSLSGLVTDAEGRAVPQVLVSAYRPDVLVAGSGAGLEAGRTMTDVNGRFVLHGLPVGQYVLHALRRPSPRPVGTAFQGEVAILLSRLADRLPDTAAGLTPPAEPTLSATKEIAIDDRSRPVTLTLAHAPRVRGRVVFSGPTPAPPPEDIAALRILLRPVDAVPATLLIPDRVADDGRFTTYGSPSGRYALSVQGEILDRWWLRSAVLDGVDYADRPLALEDRDRDGMVITFSDRGAAISGQATRLGAPDRDAVVVVFPADRTMWSSPLVAARRLRESLADESGRYALDNLPSGDYFVAAGSAEAMAGWRKSASLERLAATAVQVHLNEGERQSLDLRVSARRP
jgi:hypothetical protein